MIKLSGVGKTYDDGTVAVQQLDLQVEQGEMAVLVGPSGCGKSTTLKMINRLIEPTTGTIEIDGVDVTRTDPVELRRGIGYVIQQVGLFPHQKIETNVMTVPLLHGESRQESGRQIYRDAGECRKGQVCGSEKIQTWRPAQASLVREALSEAGARPARSPGRRRPGQRRARG